MIPKIIHYVWVGNQPKSELILACIASWKKFLPDYELMEWDNEKFHAIKNTYSDQAYQYKKWAFVSDYIRLYALYHHGGIYLDTDVEVTQDITSFLKHDFFSGYENYQGAYSPITAVMGSSKGHYIVSDLLDYYLTAEFVTAAGLSLQSNTARISRYFEKKFGVSKPYDGTRLSVLDESCVIYPSTHFCTPEANHENFSIHHFNGSWLDGYARRNKFSLLGRYVFVRFRKNKKVNSVMLPLYENEKLIVSFKMSSQLVFGLIEKIKK
jgi:hypothetical protein